MKLKKIISLALAGVLAVSMLAGCSNGSSSSNNTNDGDVTVTSSVLDTIKAAVENASKTFEMDYKTLSELEGKLSTELSKAAPEDWDDTIDDVIKSYYPATDVAKNSTNFAGQKTTIEAYTGGETKYFYQAYDLDSKVTGTTSLVMKAYDIAADLVQLPAQTTNGKDIDYTLSAVECTGKKADGTSYSKVIVLVKVAVASK